jgi:hypothetical protein
MISAAMLSTSTFAWFTMNREVELKNITMTATVPEDIQISLGHLTSPGTEGLSGDVGYIGADDGGATAPSTGNDQTSMLDWSNTANIAAYYQFGRLIPASSKNGEEIFFTPDADKVGKTVKNTADYYQATNGLTANADTTVASGTGTSLAAKLHAITSAEQSGTAWSATASTAYNVTNDDGYYVDVPFWLRTSSTAGVSLKVDAYVIPNTATAVATGATDELYKATRIAILPSGTTGDTVDASSAGLKKLIDLQDGWDGSAVKANPYDLTNASILDWYGDKKNQNTGSAITDGVVDATGKLSNTDIYAAATSFKYTDGTVIATLPASTDGTSYGQMKKYILRVWLEGEDPECWNANAGQDWTISMRFSKVEAAASSGSGSGETGG